MIKLGLGIDEEDPTSDDYAAGDSMSDLPPLESSGENSAPASRMEEVD